MSNFSEIRGVVEHEDNLINHRFSWLIVAQSFLMAAWATTTSDFAKCVLIWTGLSSVVFTYLSIWAAIVAVWKIKQHPKAGEFQSKDRLPTLTSPLIRHVVGLFGPVLVPLVFILAWICALRRAA